MLLCILEARHFEVVWQLEISLGITLERLEVYNQRVFDCENSVVINVLAVPVEDLRNDRFVSRRSELFQKSAYRHHSHES